MWYTNGNEVLRSEELYKMPDEKTPWVVKGVPEYIRRKVKIYAVQRGMTMAQAVEQIVNSAIPGEEWEVMGNPMGSPSVPSDPWSRSETSGGSQSSQMIETNIRTWLEAWVKGERPDYSRTSPPPPWINQWLTHERVQEFISDRSDQHPARYFMVWIALHLDGCEQCSRFAHTLVNTAT